jgi:hypothetical protein
MHPPSVLSMYTLPSTAQHVLVVTRDFESQADPLNARDLEATMQVGRGGRGGVDEGLGRVEALRGHTHCVEEGGEARWG